MIPPVLILILLPLASCGRDSHPEKAYAEIVNSEGKGVGTVLIQQVGNGVKFHLYIHGLPKGKYGFAVHDFGECDLPDFINAGKAFPTDENRAATTDSPARVPALGQVNVEADDVVAQHEAVSDIVTLGAGENSLFHPGGTSLVVYPIPPDAQSLSNDGKRVACGVIFQSTADEDIPQTVPEGELEDANTPRDMDIPGESHHQPK